jgi:hypothetical protein
MTATVHSGKVIFRRWDRSRGLTETEQGFSTLNRLFELCLQADDPLLVDRVLLEGTGPDGALRTVTLSFQSVTVPGRDDGV